ncbi:MAG TPA: tripartite tricarboxylate transporter substrate binding protein [Burkholderiales bacterium]|nr:tripartite tricarboxylate transporter substrate binding protein [Burkholderiales bacterium]
MKALAWLLAACGAAFAPAAAAQAYPSRPITMVVPFTPGGGTDLMGRLFSDRLSKGLGVQVIVDNRPGAGGTIGTEYAARAEPNGYTLLMGSVSTISINPSLYKNLASNPMKDLAPVSLVASTPSIVAVPVGLPVDSMQQLIALAKQKPGGLNFGSAGTGTSHHLSGELLKVRAGIDMVHVPYKGTAPALTGLIRGDVQILIANIPSLAPAIQGKQIKPIAITSLKRSPQMPELRTVAESGLPGFEVTVWYGIFAPAGTPEAVIQRLNAEIRKITVMPDVQEHLLKEGADAVASSPQELRERMQADYEKWGDIVRRAGVTAN